MREAAALDPRLLEVGLVRLVLSPCRSRIRDSGSRTWASHQKLASDQRQFVLLVFLLVAYFIFIQLFLSTKVRVEERIAWVSQPLFFPQFFCVLPPFFLRPDKFSSVRLSRCSSINATFSLIHFGLVLGPGCRSVPFFAPLSGLSEGKSFPETALILPPAPDMSYVMIEKKSTTCAN